MGKPRKFESNITPAEKSLAGFKYKDLKRACVVRGIDFQQLVEGTFLSLGNWFKKHYDDDTDPELLNQFDDWVESQIKDESLIHPTLRLGYIGEKDEDTGEILKTKRVKGIKKKKKKRERDNKFGIFKGTKKALTFQCQQEGIELEETIAKVIEEFPEASDKSIRIWYKKAERLSKNED